MTTKRIQIKDYHLAESDKGEYCGLYLGNLSINQSSPFAAMPMINEDVTYTLIFAQLINERVLPHETGTEWGILYDQRKFLVSGRGDQRWIMFGGYEAPRDQESEKRKLLPRAKRAWEFWRK